MRRMICATIVNLLLIGHSLTVGAVDLPVVPGAFGFGMATRAAYACGADPRIYRVSSLANSGGGTLREAMEAAGPRIVLFETSGTIVLSSDIVVTSPCLTVAGQTAPSPGITLRGSSSATESAGGLIIYTHDVLLQHLRIRPGDVGALLVDTAAHDGILIWSYAGGTAYNVVVDHCSMSWASAKQVQIARPNNGNVTVWRSILSEALYRAANVSADWAGSGHPSSIGMHYVPTNGADGVSVIGNLFAHNSDRNPETGSWAKLHIINNVFYDWGHDANSYQWSNFFYGIDGAPWYADIVGNKYIGGPGSHPFTPLYGVGTYGGGAAGSQLYLSDNALDSSATTVNDYINYMGFDPRVGTPPVSLSGISVLPSSAVEASVLGWVGARPADRDSVDTRIVAEVAGRTGGMISSQNSVGGWPVLAVNTTTLAVPATPHAVQASGYTAIEEWLHGLATALEGGAPPPLPAPRNLRITALAANTEVNALCTLLNSGFLDLYTGPQPTTADTALTTQTRLASLGFQVTACPSASGGSATANTLTADSDADATGTAAFYRAWKSDHTTPVFDGSVNTSGADLNVNDTFVAAHNAVTVTAFVITSALSGSTLGGNHNPKLTDLGANTKANALCALLNNGFLDIYDGSQPASADTAIGSQIRLASLRFNATACASAVAGVATANAITSDTDADASGTAAWFRAWKSDHTTSVFDGGVGTANSDLLLSSTTIALHGTVSVASFTITASKG